MGQRGPQKKPKALKDLEGNPGHRPVKDAPEAKGRAICPSYMPAYAKVVWKRIFESMPPQLYARCDTQLLSAYCCAAALHKRAVEEVNNDGEVATGNNGAPYQNPWVSIQNKQAQLLATLGSRLGLDPAARASLQLPKEQKQSKFADLVPIRGGRNGS